MTRKQFAYFTITAFAVMVLLPEPANASLESSLLGLKAKLTGVIMPVVAVMGICFAGISFFTGNPNAKQHIFYAVIGAGVGFGAQAIVDFLSQVIR